MSKAVKQKNADDTKLLVRSFRAERVNKISLLLMLFPDSAKFQENFTIHAQLLLPADV